MACLRLRPFVLALAALLLAACGGGSSPEPAQPPALQGTGSTGYRILNDYSVRAASGTPRSLQGSPQGDGHYRLPLDDLPPPYVLRASTPVSFEVYHALVTAPGAANVTPLTELAAASLLGEPPVGFYDGLREGISDVAPITAAALQQAEARVRTLVEQRFGIVVPDAVAAFGSVPFEVAQDQPMIVVIRGLRQALADRGRLFEDLVAQVAEDSARCTGEALAVSIDGAPDRFCPRARTTASEGGLQTYGFDNVFGDTLELRLQGGSVLGLRYVHAGRAVACEGGACSGLAVGAERDGTRQITLAATVLGGVTLSGTLHTGNAVAPRPCIGIPMTLTLPDGTPEQRCVARRVGTRKFSRVSHAFLPKGDAAWLLNVIVDGDRVVWVSVGNPLALTNPDGGQRWRCKDAGCAGASIGPPAADGTRTLVLDGVRLGQVGVDGSFDATTMAVLDATLQAVPPVEAPLPTCTPAVGLTLANSDGVTTLYCGDTLAVSPSWEDTDGDGTPDVFYGSVLDPPRFTLTVNVLAYDVRTGAVDRVEVLLRYVDSDGAVSPQSVQYACQGSGCRGVTAALEGELTRVTFAGTVLQERDPDGGPGDRTLTLAGSLR